MSKRQEEASLSAWLATHARSLALTRQEQAMAAAILLSMLVGALVLHFRREYHLAHPSPAAPGNPGETQIPSEPAD
jgi:hypothetical protein